MEKREARILLRSKMSGILDRDCVIKGWFDELFYGYLVEKVCGVFGF